MFQNGALRKIFGSEKDKVTWECRRHIVRSIMVCFCSCDQIKKNDMGGACCVSLCVCVCVCACVEGEVHIGFWWGNLRDKDHLEDLGIDRIVLTWIFEFLRNKIGMYELD